MCAFVTLNKKITYLLTYLLLRLVLEAHLGENFRADVATRERQQPQQPMRQVRDGDARVNGGGGGGVRSIDVRSNKSRWTRVKHS